MGKINPYPIQTNIYFKNRYEKVIVCSIDHYVFFLSWAR